MRWTCWSTPTKEDYECLFKRTSYWSRFDLAALVTRTRAAIGTLKLADSFNTFQTGTRAAIGTESIGNIKPISNNVDNKKCGTEHMSLEIRIKTPIEKITKSIKERVLINNIYI